MLRALQTVALSVVGLLVAVGHVVALMAMLWGLVFVVPWVVSAGRWMATRRRRLAGIPLPYQPTPPRPEPDEDGLYRYGDRLYKKPIGWSRLEWMLEDRATWRDLVFLALDPLGLVVFPLHARWTRFLLRPPRRSTPAGAKRRMDPFAHCMAYFGLSLLSPLGFLLYVVSPRLGRQLVRLRRFLAGKWTGVEVAWPYVGPVWRDRATWRDLAFLAVDGVVGTLLVVVPCAVMIYASWGLLIPFPFQLATSENWGNGWYGQFAGSTWLVVVMVPVLMWLTFRISPWCAAWDARWVRVLLSPTRKAQLALRVKELTSSRAAVTDVQAAELRRIERDLHDGAQAQLVAMGVDLGAVERLIDSDPAAAKKLLARVKDTSAQALVELRRLVRGIHPPVLAERGLGDAVRALALDLGVAFEVSVPRRLDPPVESAAYFAVSEALGQAVAPVSVSVVLSGEVLEMTVSDSGRGSSFPGISRRLGAFDGSVSVSFGAGRTVRMTLSAG